MSDPIAAWDAYVGFWHDVLAPVPAWAVYAYTASLWLLWRRHRRRMADRMAREKVTS